MFFLFSAGDESKGEEEDLEPFSGAALPCLITVRDSPSGLDNPPRVSFFPTLPLQLPRLTHCDLHAA